MQTAAFSVGIIGAGLAGCEAALTLARSGVNVVLYEMRPGVMTPAHKTALPAELVCSNSFKSNDLPSAQALLKKELFELTSPLFAIAAQCAVPAGSALAVDREKFSEQVACALHENALIVRQQREMSGPQPRHGITIIAAGPLASPPLMGWIGENFSTQALHFYDAIAPILSLDSINTNVAFYGSRWKPELFDYLNCPFTEEEYNRFYDALIAGDTAVKRDFEDERFFEACLPVEVIARRGKESLAFGPLKPIGFKDPRTGRMPYAVCQLRRETADGEGFGMVAFQTRLTISAQQSAVRLIPGLENAEFLRYGSCHRNSYINSPELLSADLSFKKMPDVFCAGQLCGSEGYTESIATGHIAALFVLARLHGKTFPQIPVTTACGALMRHVTASDVKPFSPSSFNFGLLPALQGLKRIGKREKHELLCKRALEDFARWKTAGGIGE